MKHQPTPIGQRIRIMREAHGLSRPQLAQALNQMSCSTLKNYEMGFRYPGAEILESIAQFVSAEWALFVLGAAPQPDPNPGIQPMQQEAA